jgi:hypothetical protein
MEKNILVTDGRKVLVRVIISHEEDMASIAPVPIGTLLKNKSKMQQFIQKFITWQKEFFSLEGFDNYNDPRF